MSTLPALPAHASTDFAGWRRILWLDLALLLLVRRWERHHATRWMRTFTRLGDTSSWVLMTFVLAAVPGEGAALSLLVAGGATAGVAASQALKRVCRRSRPSTGAGGRAVAALVEIPDAFSFPSGHTAVAFAVAAALASPEHALGELAAVLAAGIGVSRVYLGAHYPLDVVVGAAVGVACGWGARGALVGWVMPWLGLG